MELVPAGVSLSFEVTFDSPGLSVGMSVYDTSGSSPVLVQGPTLMALVFENTYSAKFIAVATKTYVIVKAVYTDSSLATVDSNYAQGSESIIAEVLSGGGSGGCGELVGYVYGNDTLIGLVVC